MDADGRGTPVWSTTSPEELDKLALEVLRAARHAASELRTEQPDPARRAWALGVLEGRTQAMLASDLPDLPTEAKAQDEFVSTALALAVHVRAHSWAPKDFGENGVAGQPDVPHPGERVAADAFDVLGRLMLPDSSDVGWTATLVTDLSQGDKILEMAVKLGKYILHPTFLLFVNDTTRMLGEAVHASSVSRLNELASSLNQPPDRRRFQQATPPAQPTTHVAPDVPEAPALRQPRSPVKPFPQPDSVTKPPQSTPPRKHRPVGLPEVRGSGEKTRRLDSQHEAQRTLDLSLLPPSTPCSPQPPETPGSPSADRGRG